MDSAGTATPVIDFDALTETQREVLAKIAIDEDGGHARSTLASLLKKYLIAEYEEQLPGRPVCFVKRYVVPTWVHIQWCEWCSRQPE